MPAPVDLEINQQLWVITKITALCCLSYIRQEWSFPERSGCSTSWISLSLLMVNLHPPAFIEND